MNNNEECFFDVHCHAMNLSHPNITAFLRRVNVNLLLIAMPLLGIEKKIKKIKNLLAVMENDIAGFFLVMEYYLKAKGIVKNNTFEVGDRGYKKIVLTPLMIDFGLKHANSETFYNIPPQKPIVEQVVDVFNGIAKYSRYEMVVDDKGDVQFKEVKKEDKLFEIYPFLGINTQNYKKIDIDKIKRMLNKYFSDYKGDRSEFYKNMGTFTGNIEDLGSNVFAGIKLYPPLGFDPWPDDGTKLIAIYETCCDKNIPITIHCSDGGFKTETNDNIKKFTNPLRWGAILKNFPTLKLNFAHFGKQKNILWFIPQRKWEKTILEFMTKYENVYADFSYSGCNEGYYKYLQDLLKDTTSNPNKKSIAERILFGSDFMINLLSIDSYNDYLEYFATSQSIDKSNKHLFCSVNPSRFLFG